MTFTTADQARLDELQAQNDVDEQKFYYNEPLYYEWCDLCERKASVEDCAAYPIGRRMTRTDKNGKKVQGVVVEHRKHTSYPGRLKGKLRPVVKWDDFKRKQVY